MKKHLVIWILCGIFIIGCSTAFLDKISAKYEFLLRLADLAQATVKEDHEIDWAALEHMGKTYGIDVKTPTEEFLVAAGALKAAYKDLYAAVDDARNITEHEEREELRKVLQRMELEQTDQAALGDDQGVREELDGGGELGTVAVRTFIECLAAEKHYATLLTPQSGSSTSANRD